MLHSPGRPFAGNRPANDVTGSALLPQPCCLLIAACRAVSFARGCVSNHPPGSMSPAAAGQKPALKRQRADTRPTALTAASPESPRQASRVHGQGVRRQRLRPACLAGARCHVEHRPPWRSTCRLLLFQITQGGCRGCRLLRRCLQARGCVSHAPSCPAGLPSHAADCTQENLTSETHAFLFSQCPDWTHHSAMRVHHRILGHRKKQQPLSSSTGHWPAVVLPKCLQEGSIYSACGTHHRTIMEFEEEPAVHSKRERADLALQHARLAAHGRVELQAEAPADGGHHRVNLRQCEAVSVRLQSHCRKAAQQHGPLSGSRADIVPH